MLKVGDKAPVFELNDQNGRIHRLSDYKGKTVVLYFYPKDMTPGCTAEACGFRDDFSEFEKKGVSIIGVSNDDEASHKKFMDKHELPFILLADKEKKTAKDYGTYGEKSFLGKKYMGISRMTFLIDGKGIIRKIYPKVDVKYHSMEILEDLRGL